MREDSELYSKKDSIRFTLFCIAYLFKTVEQILNKIFNYNPPNANLRDINI